MNNSATWDRTLKNREGYFHITPCSWNQLLPPTISGPKLAVESCHDFSPLALFVHTLSMSST